MGFRFLLPGILLTGLALAACGGSDVAATPGDSDLGGLSMGGEALGGNARTTGLASYVLEEPPTAEVAWIGTGVQIGRDATLDHRHELAFVYAVEGSHRLEIGSDRHGIDEGEGLVIPAGATHRHEGGDGATLFLETRLAPPGSAYPAGDADEALSLFESEPLGELPQNPLVVFVHVLVPSGGETSVHTHPGPEFITQIDGRINYENAIIGAIEMEPGGFEGIPAGTAVQKRNPFAEDAEFLSWFVVDANQPFASPARFPLSETARENLAALTAGARVSGASSIFGGGDNDSAWGANNAIDGDPATEWSSQGDGGESWIEIELPARTRVTGIGFWTRTMGTSAEIHTFQVITDEGEIHGPFQVNDALSLHYFDTDLTATRLRFEAVETSGGNTGVVEVAIYGTATSE